MWQNCLHNSISPCTISRSTVERLDNQNVNVPVWIPFSLTLVEYPAGDVLGAILAFFSLVPFAFFVAHFCFLVVLRDCHTLFFLCGVLSCHLLNICIKFVVGELRPVPTFRREDAHFSIYGMPSNHAQYTSFLLIYLGLFAFLRLPCNEGQFRVRLVCLLVGTLGSFGVVYSRVYLMYHSVEQVGFGCAIGALFGFLWFWLMQNVFTPYFPRLIGTRVAERLGIIDLTDIPNASKFLAFVVRQESLRRRKETQ